MQNDKIVITKVVVLPPLSNWDIYTWVYQKSLWCKEATLNGNLLTIQTVNDETLYLSPDRHATGLQVLCDKHPHIFEEIEQGESSTYITDAWIQCCIFGDIVYAQRDRVSDLLSCAYEGGSNYWADFSSPSYVTSIVDDQYIIYVEERYEEQVHRLTRDKIVKGMKVMQNKYPYHWTNFKNENEDAETGDVFLQCCIFGDIVYG